jgi:hypothetical protein
MHSVLILAALVWGQTAADGPAKEKPYWLDAAKEHLADCKVFPTGHPDEAYVAHGEPVFHHIQNTRAKSVGSVFLFLEPSGRPAAVGDVFLFPRPKTHELYNEWHSLASVPITVKWSGGTLMEAREAGLAWSAIPKAEALAAARAARERQARDLARRFTANLINKMNDKYELRLLTPPLFRYHADEKLADTADFASGAMFAFCQETDPEIFLFIEARRTDGGMQWMFAAAEFSNLNLFLQLDGAAVWSANPPQFNYSGPHVGGKLKDIELAVPQPAKAER